MPTWPRLGAPGTPRSEPGPVPLHRTVQPHLRLCQLGDTGWLFQQMSTASRGEGPARGHSLERSPGSHNSSLKLFLLCHRSPGPGACPVPSGQAGAQRKREGGQGSLGTIGAVRGSNRVEDEGSG